MREVKLHDTRTGALQRLEPRDPGKVGIYFCGPTVYGRIHVGNARPFVVFSLLKRFLEHEGYAVRLVSNITDINDKIYTAARQADVSSGQLAEDMTAAYTADTDRLGLGRPDAEPKATETVPEIVSLIQTLIDREHAYVADGDVYFRVRSYSGYGELSHRDPDMMDQGEGVAGTQLKEDPLDFALWKAHKSDEDTAWDAPWGRGRPGWHIECSAMAEELLGLDFDIHGGGSDLVFPHHENEAAQTQAARGKPLARLWVHNGMVRLDGEKMAKSVGNIHLLHEALERFGRDTLVMYFLGGHYRQPLAFSQERLEEAAARVERIREAASKLAFDLPTPADMAPLKERFFAALAEDFNTPAALAALFDWVREANRRPEAIGAGDLIEMLDVVGLKGLSQGGGEESPLEDQQLRALVEQREVARNSGDYAEADRIRDGLRQLGWEVRDGSTGPELKRIG